MTARTDPAEPVPSSDAPDRGPSPEVRASRTSLFRRLRALAPFARHPHEAWLGLLVLIVLGAHLAICNMPKDAFIFDEAFYVPAARCLLRGEVCNVEHPPLAKALIALGIRFLGDEGFAWRLPSIAMGTLAILFLYSLTRRLRDRKTALLAAFLLSFETLWFTHSSIAMLDIVAVSLGLLALLWFVRGEWVWAGAVVGLSMLAKEVTALLIGILPLFALLQCPKALSRSALRQAGRVAFFVGASAFIVFMTGLQIYDSLYHTFPTAFAHVAHMLRYNRAIASPPLSDAVQPFQWFSGFTPSGYFVTFATISKDVKRTFVQYYGQPNLVVVLLVWLALPFSFPAVRRKDPNATLHTLLLLVPFAFFLGLAHWRITYPYYMLVCLPSICVLCATFLAGLPGRVIWVYGLGVVMWFLVWFPRNLLTLGVR
jgi:4-amino-4-deoxy-L-arabinose transferase-like glycosyltransferase